MTGSDQPVADGVAALARFFIGDGTFGDALTRVAELCRDAVSADMAGVTMLVEGRLATGVFTDPEALDIDRRQYEAGGLGPCVDALQHQVHYHIADTRTDERWPEFAATAASHGIVTTLSLPLSRTGQPLGAMNLYSRTPGLLGEDDAGVDAALLLAAQAGIVVANARVYHEARELGENLTQALESRAVIDYAIGLLMSTGGRSPDVCFSLLKKASQRENRKIRDIAADLVAAAQLRVPHPPEVRPS